MAMIPISDLKFSKEVTLLRQRAGDLQTPLFLVGGAVRDHLAGRPAADFDFAVAPGGEDLPWSVAREIGGRCFWLDQQRGQCRIVLKKDPGMLTFDFAPLLGGSITDDLRARDFTVNAFALDLSAKEPVVIDPLGGVDDLRGGILRRCSATSFSADPLRLLRAFRFAAALGLSIEEATRSAIAADAQLISRIAGERIREELFKILSRPGASATFRDMYSLGLLPHMFPPLPDVPAPALAAIDRMEQACAASDTWLPRNNQELYAYRGEELEGGIKVESLLKLASFLKMTHRNASATISERLRLGRKAHRMLHRLLQEPDGQLVHLSIASGCRTMYRLFKDLDAGPEIVLFAVAHYSLPESSAKRLLAFYFHHYCHLQELVTGADILDHFGVKEGQEVGAALRAVRAEERTGSLATREEALDFLRRKLLTKDHS